ncbi:hypothetical protein QR680_002280 [Steinernema hermaphroditum]|uniref:Methanethiol oxidase n=1 Tax=Steinernema hermaphroditum TaxID=289476 RepID=A0AA39H307_9BILA|nr:hypothetical protein QR680_002280 [Steinernema hermaphroditum]
MLCSTSEMVDGGKSGCCGSGGPGYASPADAINGPKEKVLFVTCPSLDKTKGDVIATVDVDPDSETYNKIIGKVEFPHKGDEVHHTGWNACSSCYTDSSAKRSHLVAPCLHSSRVYFIDTADPTDLKLAKILEPSDMLKFDVSFPHTSHCLADGNIMISTLGDAGGNAKGSFLLVDGKTFEPNKIWTSPDSLSPQFNYDFWYQPRRNVMISTEWGTPNFIKGGFNPAHVAEGQYGNKVHVFDWKEHNLLQSIELDGPEGWIPLEVRFLHEPTSPFAFVGTALGSGVFLLYKGESDSEYKSKLVASIPPKKVSGWALPEMPALITDILVSMDDKYLYLSCWLHGDLRQYDISDPFNPKLVGQIFLGGSIHKKSGVTVIDDKELKEQPDARYIKGKKVRGAPQMLQLSLDGRRLYVTTSLYSVWDKQFYPDMGENGGMMLQLDVDVENGGMKLNEAFLVDFADELGAPYLGHEMRYPGGDCTSDIWI